MVFYEKNEKTGIVGQSAMTVSKMEYRCAVNLKEFYNALHTFFLKNPEVQFKDSLGSKTEKAKGNYFDFQAKEGEFVEDKTNLNRHGDMFEKRFTWAKNDGSVEFELIWEGKANIPHSAYGWFEIKIDLVNRNIVDVEVDKNGVKQKLQNGTWEFRNKIEYHNKVLPEFIRKVPFVKNSKKLEDLYLEYMYLKTLENEFRWCKEKIKAPLVAFIESYFSP